MIMSISEIANTLVCSRKMIYNALNHIRKYVTFKNVKQTPWPRKTSRKEDSLIYRTSVKNPFKSSTVIQREISRKYSINVSCSTIRRRLNEKNVRGCISQHKSYVSNKNLRERLCFARVRLEKCALER